MREAWKLLGPLSSSKVNDEVDESEVGLTYGLRALGKQVLLLDGRLGDLGLDRGQGGRHNLNLG